MLQGLADGVAEAGEQSISVAIVPPPRSVGSGVAVARYAGAVLAEGRCAHGSADLRPVPAEPEAPCTVTGPKCGRVPAASHDGRHGAPQIGSRELGPEDRACSTIRPSNRRVNHGDPPPPAAVRMEGAPAGPVLHIGRRRNQRQIQPSQANQPSSSVALTAPARPLAAGGSGPAEVAWRNKADA